MKDRRENIYNSNHSKSAKEFSERIKNSDKIYSLFAKKTPIEKKRKFPTLKQLKYLPKALSKKERLFAFSLFLIILICSFVLLWRFYNKQTETIPDFGDDYSEGLIGEPKNINPILAQTNDVDMDISRLVFSGLMKYDSRQNLVPDLAESFEISEDQKNYIFHLRKGTKWHDDQEVTAEDIIFTIQSIKNPDFQSPLRLNFQEVAVEKLDDYTVKFTLTKETFSPFLKENTSFGILPKHIWQNIPPKNAVLADLNLKPIGCGPYKFKEFKKDKEGNIKSYTLIQNKDYFGEGPFIKEITFNFYQSYSDLIKAYNHKDILGISSILKTDRDQIERKINFYSLRLPRYFALFFNQSRNKALQEKDVRTALALALDKQKIIDEALLGQGEIVDSPILPNFLGYNPEIKKHLYNQKEAEELLHKAGWNKVDEQGKRWKGKMRLEFTIITVNQPELIRVVEQIKQYWEKIGAQVNIKTLEATELQSEYIRPRNYEILLYGELLGHDPDPYPFWHSSQRIDPGLNLTSFKNTTIDELLESARKTTDEEQRRLKYIHFQNIIAEEIPAIFLYSPTYLYGVSPKIKGIKIDYVTFPSDRFVETNKWFIKTDRKWK